MSEQERIRSSESQDEVEAHKHRLAQSKSDLAPESGAELEYDADSTGISVRGTGLYGPGIGRVGFVLGQEPPANVLDREDVDYAVPLPKRVTAAWQSAALTPGAPYRVFFHVYDRCGANLVAYDRRDFTCPSTATMGTRK